MTYARTDPRAQLGTANGHSTDPETALAPQYLDFHAMVPNEESPLGTRTWIVRSANAVLVYAELGDGEVISREETAETMVVVLPGDGTLTVTAGDQEEPVAGTAIVTIAPGAWRCRAAGPVRMLRLHPTSAQDLLTLAQNADAYVDGTGNAVGATPWPAPTGTTSLRVYDHIEDVPSEEGRLGRIYRGRHAMINVIYPRTGPRDPRTLSPHTHDDFEQLSFVDSGRYIHHIRRAWGKDRTRWVPDEHHEIGGPSVTIIPPPLVHTSEAVGTGENRMLDIFAGPRKDFSARPGWVLNAADYPEPLATGTP